MEPIIELFESIYKVIGPGIYVILILLTFIGVLGQWSLYEKCKLPGYACLVPVWNVIVFLKIMGRPAWQVLLFLVPVYNIYFIIKIYVELCHCFGKRKPVDYLLVILFNGFYVLYLGLSHDINYIGKDGVKDTPEKGVTPQFA